MPKSRTMIDAKGEVREPTLEDLKAFQSIRTLPPALQRKVGARGPQKSATKERITIRLSRDVVGLRPGKWCKFIAARQGA